ncbi:MAG: DUF2218 domain-containing protein, partial [Pseudomonadota bacterium]
IKRLCRHFAHKVPVTLSQHIALIQFPFGSCRMNARDEFLDMKIEVADHSDIEKAEQVIEQHLIRMANRDDPVILWKRENPNIEEKKQ